MLINLETRLISKHLKRSPPEDWMFAVCSLSYDGDEEVIEWIMSQPTCDKAVALALYWRLAPRWMAQYAGVEEVSSHERANYEILRRIERRYQTGFYKNARLAFDPANDPQPIGNLARPGYDWTADYADQPLRIPIPDEMFRPVAGRAVDFAGRFRDWTEGMPPPLLAKLDRAVESPL